MFVFRLARVVRQLSELHRLPGHSFHILQTEHKFQFIALCKTVRSRPMNMCKKRSVGKAIINLEVRICRQSTKGQEAEG